MNIVGWGGLLDYSVNTNPYQIYTNPFQPIQTYTNPYHPIVAPNFRKIFIFVFEKFGGGEGGVGYSCGQCCYLTTKNPWSKNAVNDILRYFSKYCFLPIPPPLILPGGVGWLTQPLPNMV